jgi:hypothetical protein
MRSRDPRWEIHSSLPSSWKASQIQCFLKEMMRRAAGTNSGNQSSLGQLKGEESSEWAVEDWNSSTRFARSAQASGLLRVDRTRDAHAVRSSIYNVSNAAFVTQDLHSVAKPSHMTFDGSPRENDCESG